MKKKNHIAGSYKKVIAISIFLVILLGISVVAGNVKLNSVKIKFSNNHEIEVLTSKTKVSEILKEKHIILSSDEIVVPGLDEEITSANSIIITKENEEIIEVAEVQKDELDSNVENKIENYSNIVEEIITEEEIIPYETITKDVSTGGTTTNKVIQIGKNGIKEVTYKVKYKNDEIIEKKEISSRVIKEPVNKIVQVQTRIVTSRSSSRAISGSVAEYQSYAAQVCNSYGWSETDFECLVKLWNKESGWNPNAYNASSGAYGIPQALPGSKMASAGSDYQTNYQTQINWGLNYIKARYGTPQNAWHHSQTVGWY